MSSVVVLIHGTISGTDQRGDREREQEDQTEAAAGIKPALRCLRSSSLSTGPSPAQINEETEREQEDQTEAAVSSPSSTCSERMSTH
ncbi:hypothetical protein VZT92_009804 [Zoarces viviparus]|uniref:Uncharacterized protein n=1 Tax=Zoarces viviparus TaxID=48416 RepID=A0AAW1FDF2_ZOAVI